MESDFYPASMLNFGAYAGYGLENFEIGAEFAYFQGDGRTSNIMMEGTVQPDTSGT